MDWIWIGKFSGHSDIVSCKIEDLHLGRLSLLKAPEKVHTGLPWGGMCARNGEHCSKQCVQEKVETGKRGHVHTERTASSHPCLGASAPFLDKRGTATGTQC